VRFVDRAPPGSGRDGANADLQVAAAVAEGRADAGFGLRAAAARMRLDFVPLATERYFLAAARRTLRSAAGQSLMQVLRGAEFARSVARLPGYDASHAGAHESLAAALSWIGCAGRRKAVREHA
jgi:molybdate-binding protein